MIGSIKQGIDSENAKKITKLIRDEGPPKGVKAQIQGDEIRVSSKKRDDLQAVQSLLRGRRPRGRAAVRQLSLGAERDATVRMAGNHRSGVTLGDTRPTHPAMHRARRRWTSPGSVKVRSS